MASEDLPPVSFGFKIVDINEAHVRLTLFAGEHPDARGMAGSLTLRRAEYMALVDRLRPESIIAPSGMSVPEVCCCDLIDTSCAGGPPSYTRGRSNGCRVHPSERDAADRAAREEARRAT